MTFVSMNMLRCTRHGVSQPQLDSSLRSSACSAIFAFVLQGKLRDKL